MVSEGFLIATQYSLKKRGVYVEKCYAFRDKWVPVTTAWRVLSADGGTACSCEYIE
jgi:hypothetical protein